MSFKLVCDNCGDEWHFDPAMYRSAYPSMWEAFLKNGRMNESPDLRHTRHLCDACCRARDEGARLSLLARRPIDGVAEDDVVLEVVG